MIPGPDIIIACPNCDALAKVFSLTSGNTFGASIWTDGKMDAPMLPRPPAITKCHGCDTIYWVADAKQIGEYSFWESEESSVDPAWKDAPEIEQLTEDEYFHAIDSGLGETTEKEQHLRLVTWWCSNDRYRDSSTSVDQAPEDRCVENMHRLFDLLDAHDVNDRITKAEVARELGNFTKAIDLATTIDDEDTEHVKTFLLNLCREKTTVVKLIPDPKDA
jgi:hypothetical protein